MASATLTWLPSPDPTVFGYKIWAGRASFDYSAPGSPKDVGNVTTGTFDLLGGNGVWYFAISAYNAFGDGPRSAEITGVYDEVLGGVTLFEGFTPRLLQASFIRPLTLRRIA